MTNGAAGIAAEGVRRSFADVHAVRDATFEAPRGAITALVGPNGSGKTTLMLMLASLLRPDAGSIRIAGYDPVTQPAEVRARLGWMPDVFGSWSALTCATTLEITGRLYRLDRSEARRRAAELLELVGLTGFAEQPTRVLSRGQKQRLSLARALVHQPEILILDEPASGLDPTARIALRDHLRSLASGGAAILVSSHVLAELEELADRAVYLDAGVTADPEVVERARRSRREWRIRALSPAAMFAALDADDALPAGWRPEQESALVPVEGETEAAALLGRLVGAGVEVIGFAPARGDLEHTMLDLRGGAR